MNASLTLDYWIPGIGDGNGSSGCDSGSGGDCGDGG